MAVTTPEPTPRTRVAAVSCDHCGLPVPAALVRADREHQFCCSGCEAVWHVLLESGLDDYYRLRESYGKSGAAPARVSGKSFAYLDDPEYLKRFGEPRTEGGWRVRFYLDGVHCVACSWLVEKVATERQGARYACLDLGRSVLEVVFNPAEVKLSALARALDRIGYTPHAIFEDSGSSARRRETRRLLARMGIAAACAGNIMLLAVSQYAGDYSGIEPGFSALFRWVSLGLALPAVVYSAFPYYRGAWSGLRRGVLHMDLPISLGILAAFAISALATVQNRGEVYYDSVSALIFLLLAGRLVLQRAGRWAADAGESLLALAPRSVRQVQGGDVREVLLADIRVGDRLRVLPGETVPVDGIVESERAWVRESHLTGEPNAIERHCGETVYAASIVERSALEVTATAVGETTRLAHLAEMMRSASARRAPIVTILDRVAGYFVGAVLTLAVITFIVWLRLDPDRALWNAAALLVVACPCALGLATPVALATAMGRAARRGIFIRGQDGVERIASTDHVILDKTGTLTEGALSVVDSRFEEDAAPVEQENILSAVTALERESGHLIATAFRDTACDSLHVEDCRVIPGAGVQGTIAGEVWAVGSEALVRERTTQASVEVQEFASSAAQRGHTLAWVARDERIVAVLALGDRLHKDARRAVDEMRATGHALELLSGDQSLAVARVAGELGISSFRGQVSPERKLERIEELVAAGKRVAMIGDGVNDAAALSRATVGISAAGASEVARDAADVFVSTTRGPMAIAESFRLSRRAMRVIRLNLVIAVGYNLIGATLAITGHVGPLVAAILMPLSSLTVLLIASKA